MTKKHFIALADCIRVNNKFGHEPFTEYQIVMLADFCKSQNGNFNKERWLDYIAGKCGPNGGEVKKHYLDAIHEQYVHDKNLKD
jgi:hypothetical protein